MENLIEIIQKNSLVVRCLPHVVVTLWNYREGDELTIDKPSFDGNGKIRNVKKSVIFSEKWGKKLIREERVVENGGWWYVKEVKSTDSTVIFNRKYDKFFAPTLPEAIKLYLDWKDSQAEK